jgi:6-phosphogluconolactonase
LSGAGFTRRDALHGAGAAAAWLAAPAALARPTGVHQVFVGTYSWQRGEAKSGNFGPAEATSDGVYRFAFDARTGRAGPVTLAAATPNPANLILHPNRRILYAGSSRLPIERGQHRLTAFAIAPDGSLREINRALSGGGIPTQGAIDRAGRFLVTTNFDSDNIVSLRLGSDGSVGDIVSVAGKPIGALPAQDAPPTLPGQIAGGNRAAGPTDRLRPHMALLSPDEHFALAAQMSTDSIVVLALDRRTGRLTPHQEAPTTRHAGPRHIAWGKDGRFLYSADEEGSQITAWAWDVPRGKLTAIQQVTSLPTDFRGANKPAHVAVHPGGGFVYVNNRGHGSLAGYRIDRRNGRVTPIGWTKLRSPVCWHFVFDPSGRWLLAANQSDSSTQIFAVDPGTGALSDTGQVVATPLPTSLVLV